LRKQTRLVIGMAIATALALFALTALLPLDAPARLLGLTLSLDALGRLFLLAFLSLGAIGFIASWQLPHGENFVPIALVILGLICSIVLLLQEPFVVSLLLVSVGIVAVLAIVDLPTGSQALVDRAVVAAALKYLVMMLLAGALMYMGFVLVSIYVPGDVPGRVSPARLVLGLLTIGFGLRLAIFPFHSWLPDLSAQASPMVSVFVIGAINTTSLLFFISSLQFFPVIVLENERGMDILMLLGGATALYGSLLALVQASMRRAVGYLLVYNAGMILFGLATTSPIGLTGAIFESFNQLIAILLIFLSIALLERPDGRPANVVRRDLLWRWPIAGAGLLGGSMALLGIPPFNGFASKLLIYEAAVQRGGSYLVLLLAATGIGLLALLRLARNRLLGPAEDMAIEAQPALLGATELDRPAERRLDPEPRELAFVTIVLLVVSLGIGLYPQPVLATIDDVIRGLTFARFG
jgi:formate hydrogenlyase subunit 3/multisubunit Na+/H+ antiporter MnhD subunit